MKLLLEIKELIFLNRPIVALDSQTAALIVDKLAIRHQGKIRIDIPSGNEVFKESFEQCGFTKVSKSPNVSSAGTRAK
jgi:hypothetical protein